MEDNGLALRVERVELALEKEIDKRENAVKYMSRLIEDVQARYADLMVTFGRIETAFQQHLKDDKAMGEGLQGMDARLRVIERLVWIAVGGIIVLGALIGLIGSSILRGIA